MNKDMLDIKVFNGDDDVKYIKYDDLILCLDRAKETHKELQQRLDDIIYYANKRIEEDIDDTERAILQSIVLMANGTIKAVRDDEA